MTPTLLGRWQTRLFLLATVGLAITACFGLGWIAPASHYYFLVLGYVAFFGIIWDVFYDYFQKFRWDRDWPGVFQLLAGIWEGLFILFLIKILWLPGVDRNLPIPLFVFHYSTVWLGVYTASQSLMRVLFPRSRFQGGKWL